LTATHGEETISWSEYFGIIYSAFTGLLGDLKSTFASDRLTIEDVPVDVRESIEMRLAMDGRSSVSDGKILAIAKNREGVNL